MQSLLGHLRQTTALPSWISTIWHVCTNMTWITTLSPFTAKDHNGVSRGGVDDFWRIMSGISVWAASLLKSWI